MPERDDRPFLALAALAILVLLGFLVPGSRAWLLDMVIQPLRAQADPAPGLRNGYTIGSLAVWAVVGGVGAWAAYEIVFVRARFAPDRAFFLALAPALLLGPLLHASLIEHALPLGNPVAYLGAEPLVYLTIAAFAGIGLALGRLTKRPVVVPLVWGALGVAVVLSILAPHFTAHGLRLAGILLALALGPALVLSFAYVRWRPGDPFDAILAVIGAHALDGATTWMVLRDPFGLGFSNFGERNPVSLTLVAWSNGWPYFVVKLALPIVLLSMVRKDEEAKRSGADASTAGGRLVPAAKERSPSDQERLRAFLLFAVFVLGFGPGMANLLQVMSS